MQEEQENGGKSDCERYGPGIGAAENRENCSSKDNDDGEEGKMPESEACGGVSRVVGEESMTFGIVLPCIDKETIKRGEGSKKECWWE